MCVWVRMFAAQGYSNQRGHCGMLYDYREWLDLPDTDECLEHAFAVARINTWNSTDGAPAEVIHGRRAASTSPIHVQYI
jgi:hypothetical protein